MSNLIQELIKKAKQITNSGLPFMEGLEKAEAPKTGKFTLTDYGYLKGDDGDFICYTAVEIPGHFMFGSSVMTEKFKRLEEALDPNDLAALLQNGIVVQFKEKVSKNKRRYVDCELFPEN